MCLYSSQNKTLKNSSTRLLSSIIVKGKHVLAGLYTDDRLDRSFKDLGLNMSDFTPINNPNVIITLAETLYVQNERKRKTW